MIKSTKVNAKDQPLQGAGIRIVAGAVIVLLVGVLFLYDLDGYPRTWFDEGVHLLAAQRLAQTGEYRFGPAIGPTIFYPVAASFRLWGEGLWQARWVIVGYGLLALILGYVLVRRLSNRATAILTLALWLSFPGLNFLGWSRQVLGEVPALTFFLAGTLAWNRSVSASRPYGWAALGGLGLGLAMLTKNQFAFIVPAFLLVWLADQFYYQRTRLGPTAITLGLALLVPLAWYIALPYIANPRVVQHTVEQWETSSKRSMWIGDLGLMVRNARFILGPRVFLCLLAPGLLTALPWLRRRDTKGLTASFLWLFSALWLGWYVFLSVGWERYALVGLATATPFVARLLIALWRHPWPVAKARLAATVLLGGIIGGLLVWQGFTVLTKGNHTARQMAAYLHSHISKEAMIETWEPEVAFLSEHQYHFPPAAILDGFSRTMAVGEEPPVYDPLVADPDYILVGELGRWTNLYPPEFLRTCCRPVETIGTYALFEVVR